MEAKGPDNPAAANLATSGPGGPVNAADNQVQKHESLDSPGPAQIKIDQNPANEATESMAVGG